MRPRRNQGAWDRTRSWRAVVTLLLVLGSVPAAAQASDLESDLQRTQDELESARDGLQSVERDLDAARSDLADLDARLVAMLAELAELEDGLAAAREEYEQARARTEAATIRLQQETVALANAEQTRLERQERFRDRVVATYKYGAVGYVEAFLGAEDVADVVNTAYYLRAVMHNDVALVDRIAAASREIASARQEVDALRDRLAAEQSGAASALRQVEQLAAAQRSLADRLRSQQVQRAGLVDQLVGTKAEYERTVRELQEESQRIQRELASSRWRAGAPGKGSLVWPTSGQVTSSYGWRQHPIYGSRRFHAGVDISGGTGQAIVAAAEGLVVHAGWRGGYGLTVIVDHGGGVATLYAHQSAVRVAQGEVVTQGQRIGDVGSTGNSTGAHLHFEVRVEGEPVDPMDWY